MSFKGKFEIVLKPIGAEGSVSQHEVRLRRGDGDLTDFSPRSMLSVGLGVRMQLLPVEGCLVSFADGLWDADYRVTIHDPRREVALDHSISPERGTEDSVPIYYLLGRLWATGKFKAFVKRICEFIPKPELRLKAFEVSARNALNNIGVDEIQLVLSEPKSRDKEPRSRGTRRKQQDKPSKEQYGGIPGDGGKGFIKTHGQRFPAKIGGAAPRQTGGRRKRPHGGQRSHVQA
jgi:hypothetical protein